MNKSDHLQDIQTNNILAYQENQLRAISFDVSKLDNSISESEKLLSELGHVQSLKELKQKSQSARTTWIPHNTLVLPNWDSLCKEANAAVAAPVESIESLFSEEELKENWSYINALNDDFNSLNRLDPVDLTICALAGIISGVVDILMVGIPGPTTSEGKGGTLSDFIRRRFEKIFPPKKMEALGRTKFVKTPYDAQDNRNTKIAVEGLSSHYHRALSFGHDPLLGFVVGIFDIMTGRMTTLDKNGKFVSQVMECYSDRKETNLFIALSKHILHLKSDITTPAGLPAPLSILLNYCQFGSIGEENNTIAEIAQGMYYDGYDFVQFCASSIPVMLIEVIVRMGWAIKRHKEGLPIKKCIPCSLNRDKNPKLATMLFVAHSAASAINAGKVYFSENPMAINWPQWLAFAKYSFCELKWVLYTKPEARHKYVTDKLDAQLNDILAEIDTDYSSYFAKENICYSSEDIITL